MYFKLQELKMNMGDTPIENIFISDYMPSADGNFVKVYIMGYKLARSYDNSRNFDSRIIADLLGLTESDVNRAWEYWEKAGIVEREPLEDGTFSIKFLNLKEIYIENIYSSNKTEDTKDQNSILEDKKIANLLSSADYFMRGRLSISQKQDIASWRDIYNMPTEIIEEAFRYSTEIKEKTNIKYVEAVVKNWSVNNIRSMEDIEKTYREYDEKYYRFTKIKNYIGLSYKAYSKIDFDTINDWYDKYKFSQELIMEACKKSVNINKPNIGYVNKILLNWREKGIENPDQIEIKDKKKTVVKKTKFHNFEQLSDKLSESDIEALARKKREAYLKNNR